MSWAGSHMSRGVGRAEEGPGEGGGQVDAGPGEEQ